MLELWNKLHFEEKKKVNLNLLAPELFFFNFSTPVYKMWIIKEPNTLELWNKLHFEEKKRCILTFWRRNYFFLILAHPVYKYE